MVPAGGHFMAILRSKVDAGSSAFTANALHHRVLSEELRTLTARIAEGGDERARARHQSRGKLLPRERLDRLATEYGIARDALELRTGRLAMGFELADIGLICLPYNGSRCVSGKNLYHAQGNSKLTDVTELSIL